MRVHYRSRHIWILIGAALLILLSSRLPVSLQTTNTTPKTVVGLPNQDPQPRKKGSKSVTTVPPSVSVVPQQQYQQTTIVADKRLIQLGETVTFHMEPAEVFARSAYSFLFDYGDGTPKETTDRGKRVVQHRYTSAGRFKVSVDAMAPAGVAPFEETIDPITINVQQVKLSANPRSAEVGMPVSLKATSVSKDPNLRYKFLFGDNQQTNWQESNEASHPYSAPGDYIATVEIGFGDNAVQVDSSKSDSIRIAFPQPASLVFRVKPARVNANEAVTLSAELPTKGRHIQYRFVFGDNQTSEWQDNGNQTHTYVAGTYQPTAEAGVLIEGTVVPLVTAPPKTIEVVALQPPVVSPTPTQTSPTREPLPVLPDWLLNLILVLIGLAVTVGALVLSYKAAKWAYTPKPTFVAYTDVGTATMDQSSTAHVIDFELHLDPNVGEGSYDISKTEPNLIRAERNHP